MCTLQDAATWLAPRRCAVNRRETNGRRHAPPAPLATSPARSRPGTRAFCRSARPPRTPAWWSSARTRSIPSRRRRRASQRQKGLSLATLDFFDGRRARAPFRRAAPCRRRPMRADDALAEATPQALPPTEQAADVCSATEAFRSALRRAREKRPRLCPRRAERAPASAPDRRRGRAITAARRASRPLSAGVLQAAQVTEAHRAWDAPRTSAVCSLGERASGHGCSARASTLHHPATRWTRRGTCGRSAASWSPPSACASGSEPRTSTAAVKNGECLSARTPLRPWTICRPRSPACPPGACAFLAAQPPGPRSRHHGRRGRRRAGCSASAVAALECDASLRRGWSHRPHYRRDERRALARPARAREVGARRGG